jgi:cytochrome b6-f complex iron-sulfur subunit
MDDMDIERQDMDRRHFLKSIPVRIFGSLGAVIIAYPILSFITFKKPFKKTIPFHPDEQNAMVNFKEGVYLVNDGTNTYALSSRCTHLGCTFTHDPVSQRFRCPCHGSVFDLSGKRLAGPAKADLHRIPMVREENGDILVTITL